MSFNSSHVELLQYTQSRSPELVEYINAVAASPLSFDGPHPLVHSSHNHIHLWKLEYLADTFDWIDAEYRVACVNHILEQWRRRLKGHSPYCDRGYRIYVYEDLAPTISVVAESDIGFPYVNDRPVFVKSIRDVMSLYENRSWKANFTAGDSRISEKRVLEVIASSNGSISKPTAEKIGVSVGMLRTLIVNMGLGAEVNSVRKKFQRRPADFSSELVRSARWHVFEQVLPSHYRK